MKKTDLDLDLDLVREEFDSWLERRVDSRFQTSQLSALQFGQRTTFVEVIDLSGGGAKCRISSGFSPLECDKVLLTLVDRTWRTGIVRWTSQQEFGVEFDDRLPDPQDRLFYEHLGYKSYADIIHLQNLIHR